MMSPSSAKVEATAAPLRRFHPSRNCTYSVRMAASCGWAAVTSELLGRAGTHVTLVVAPPLPFDPRRTAPEPVLGVLGRSRSAAPSPAGGTALEDVALVVRQSASADQRDGQSGQRGDGHGGAVVAQGQAFVGQQPTEGAFDHPAVSAEAGTGVAADASDPGGDPAAAQVAADPGHVVAL